MIAGACGGDPGGTQSTAGAVSVATTTTAAPAPVTPTTAATPSTTTITAAPVATTATTTVGPAAGPSTVPPTPAPAPAPARVEIAAFAFGPSPVRVRAGQTVTWTNTDAVTHSIQDTSGMATPAGPNLAEGDSFSIAYSKAGTFSYICGIHPSMEGSVEVDR